YHHLCIFTIMTNEIICPKCSNHFTLNEVMNEEMNLQLKAAREKLNLEAAEWRKQREEEFKLQIKSAADSAEKKAAEALNVKLQALERDAVEKQNKLIELQKQEVEFYKLKQDV